MKKKDMHVGFATQEELLSILKNDYTTHKNANKFRIDAREFLVTLLKKMFDKNSVEYIFKYASVPKVFVSQPRGCIEIIVPKADSLLLSI